MRRILALTLLMAGSGAAQTSLFTFRSEFWPNLHHFLYVLGRARNKAPDAQRKAVRSAPDDLGSSAALDTAIEFYQKSWSNKDAVFDKDLVAITTALAANRLDDIPADLRRTLETVAPAYRETWWPRHQKANQELIKDLEAQLAAHGRPIAQFIAKAWGETWFSNPPVVQVCAYTNWAGAYSTDGGLIVMSSLEPGNAGASGLESIFHESMHQWDDRFEATIARVAARRNARIPPPLSHSLIFFTAGYAVAQQIPGYTPYADANGVWNRGMFSRQRIVDEWTPYLKRERTMEEAIDKLLPPSPGK